MVQSTIKPKTIEIDRIKNGIVTLLAHWDIKEKERTDEMSGKTQKIYQYEECRMQWVLPKAYSTKAGITSYLASVEDEILDWAKGSKVTMV